MEILQITWLVLLGIVLSVFLALGGCDFGAAAASLFMRAPRRRIEAVNSILPFWDANGVWLITAGGGLFAAFPLAYSCILSTMYTPVIILLLLITLRVASIEFFAAAQTEREKLLWTKVVGVSSILIFFLIGLALGAIYEGDVIPAREGFFENFFRLFTSFSVASGLLLSLYAIAQGLLFIKLAAPDGGEHSGKSLSRFYTIFGLLFFVLYFITLGAWNSFALLINMIFLGAILTISALYVRKGRYGKALIFSSILPLYLVLMFSFLAYPYIVPSIEAGDGLTIWEASSSFTTLNIMLWVALIGVPLAIAYNVFCYFAIFSKSKGNLKNS